MSECRIRRGRTAAAAIAIGICLSASASASAAAAAPALDAPKLELTAPPPRPIDELTPEATIRLGKTADWVAVTEDAVWVGSTGPYAVHRIDPATNQRVASVALPGEPCAGLAVGLGSLWVPMCTATPSLAKVDLAANRLTAVFGVGPAAPEGGVTTGAGHVWLIVDKSGTLAKIDPATGAIRQTFKVPAGSYNPYFGDGRIWVTRAEGAELSRIDAATGALEGTVRTGPNPRFLTVAAGAAWTLNQGDGTLTRVDAHTERATTIALNTPGHGGDIGFGAGLIWTTMPKMPLSGIDAASQSLRCRWAGPGGDSLGIGFGAIWLTDYHAGTVARIPLPRILAHCGPRESMRDR
jgi:streptogramin lyase